MPKQVKTCAHLEFLAKPQLIPGTNREVRFIGYGHIFSMDDGSYCEQPILRGMKDTPSGRITVTSDWMPVKFCPVCGEAVIETDVKEKAEHAGS